MTNPLTRLLTALRFWRFGYAWRTAWWKANYYTKGL
jgi:hypothetical protein